MLNLKRDKCFDLQIVQFCSDLLSERKNPREGVTPHMKGVGMLVGNFELNP